MKTKKERLAIDSAIVAAAASTTNFIPILTVHQGSLKVKPSRIDADFGSDSCCSGQFCA